MRFLKKGILTTLQDGGRAGHAAIGVNRSGAMDAFSQRVLNILLDNPDDHPVLEMHFPAPEILFEESCSFALYGADFDPHLNDIPLRNGKICEGRPGDILKFKRKHSGQRCYLAIRGEFAVTHWLNSCSVDPAMKHPELPERIALTNLEQARSKTGIMPVHVPKRIRFVPEFEFETLDKESGNILQTKTFTVSPESNRMGYRLRGAPLKQTVQTELISSAVCRGILQLLPDGQLIILMADAQTTGGYPRLGYVCASDLSGLSRLGPGDTFSFQTIPESEAVQSLLRQEEYFKTLRITLGFYGY